MIPRLLLVVFALLLSLPGKLLAADFSTPARMLSQVTATQVQEELPVFTSLDHVVFQVGVAGTFTIRTTGVPTPTISISNGFLPAGMEFVDGLDGTAIIRGTPTPGTAGSGVVQLLATNALGSSSQNLSVIIGESATLDGPLFAQFVIRSLSSYTITARGNLPMTLSVNGVLPAGLSFTDSGNGSGRIEGNPAASSAGTYRLNVVASNALGSSNAELTLEVLNAAPVPGERNYSGMYYKPINPGYAVNITHQGNTLVAAWYTYNQNGRPTWYLATADRQPDGSFLGSYAVQSGIPFNQINGAQAFISTAVAGSARMIFDGNGDLDFRFVIAGETVEERRALTRFAFSESVPQCQFTNASRINASNYSDLWWQPSESGWGMTIDHQGEQIFAAWYSYDDDMHPRWLVALLSKQSDGRFVGALNKASSGVYYLFEGAGAVTNFPVPEVGSASLRFVDGENAIFTYQLEGFIQSKALERFVFGSPQQVCAVVR